MPWSLSGPVPHVSSCPGIFAAVGSLNSASTWAMFFLQRQGQHCVFCEWEDPVALGTSRIPEIKEQLGKYVPDVVSMYGKAKVQDEYQEQMKSLH